MPDHNPIPDPLDQAYVQAEALLSDEAARAARRAKVLAAVAQLANADDAPETPVLAARQRPRMWRLGGGLVAASIAGLCLLLPHQLHSPPSGVQSGAQPAAQPAAQRAAAEPSLAAGSSALSPRAAERPVPPRLSQVPPAPPPVVVWESPAAQEPPTQPAPAAFPVAPLAPAPAMAPAPPPPAPAPLQSADAGQTTLQETVVTAQRRSARLSAVPTTTVASDANSLDKATSLTALRLHQAGRLRAAAAAGRAGEVEQLLDQDTPIDASDDDGETALMKSVEADHPGVAAILRQHGASLDVKNRSGVSARDIATAKGDAELEKALGLAP